MNLKALFTKVKKDDLFNLYPDAVFILDSDFKILDLNNKACDLIETSKFNAIGENISKFIKEQKTGSITEAVNNSETTLAVAKNKTVEISASQNAEDNRIILTIRDVTKEHSLSTDLKLEYEKIKSILNEKNAYLTNCSIDILSNINSVESFSKALVDGVGGAITSKQEKYVNIINKNAKDLLYNLDKMFLLFKTESELLKKTYKSFDVASLISDISKRWEEIIKGKNLKFNTDFSNIALRNACIDQNLLELAINSLLEASYKTTEVGSINFTVQNPTLELLKTKGLEEQEQEDENIIKKYLLFEFKDTASCLNDEEIASIFSPYTLIKNPQKRTMGVKFTYPIVKKIIEDLDGVIWLENKNGNCLNFIIPIEKKFNRKNG